MRRGPMSGGDARVSRMAKKQSRSSISFNALLMFRVREEAVLDGKGESHWVSDLIIAELARRGKPFKEPLTHQPPSVVRQMRERRRVSVERKARKLGLAA